MVTDASRILLGRRPNGRWCIPCGHVEWDESIEEAAVREFREETGLQVRLGPVLAVKSNFHASDHRTVGIWFAGERIGGRLEAGDDVTEVAFASLADPPPLAFPTDQEVLQLLQNDA